MPASFAFGLAHNAPTGLTADLITAVGTTQAGAPDLTGFLNRVTTAAGQVAVDLPLNMAVGAPVIVHVTTATAATVFPPVGGVINGGAANASFSVAQHKPTVFYALPNGLDYVAVLSA